MHLSTSLCMTTLIHRMTLTCTGTTLANKNSRAKQQRTDNISTRYRDPSQRVSTPRRHKQLPRRGSVATLPLAYASHRGHPYLYANSLPLLSLQPACPVLSFPREGSPCSWTDPSPKAQQARTRQSSKKSAHPALANAQRRGSDQFWRAGL